MAEESTHLPWGPVALGWETGSGVALGKTRLIGQRVSPKTDRSCYTHTCRGRDYSLIRTIAGSWWGIFEASILSTLLCQEARLPIAWWRIGIHTVGNGRHVHYQRHSWDYQPQEQANRTVQSQESKSDHVRVEPFTLNTHTKFITVYPFPQTHTHLPMVAICSSCCVTMVLSSRGFSVFSLNTVSTDSKREVTYAFVI